MFRDPRTVASVQLAPPPARTAAAPGLHLQEVGFRTWVDSATKPDVLIVGDGGPVAVPLERALRCLLTSTAPLAPAHGDALGLPDDATIATAAALLLHARTDPDGPRCRSFRAASYFLVGQAVLDADEAT
jgi:hypothetical protein